MLFVVAVLAAVLWLPSPYSWIVLAVAAVLEVGETLFWWRYSTRRKSQVGAETLVGRRAVVTAPCFPEGQVRLDGELWAARCDGGAHTGDEVIVAGRDGLILIVEPG